MMDLLERAWLLDELDGVLAATATGGRVVLVAGEAGIGKSALVRRFTERRSADARFLLGACDPLLTPRALGPLHDIARQTGGRLAGLLASGGPREGVFAAFLDELDQGTGRGWSRWRTPTGRTRRPWTCWCSWAGGWSGPGRC